MCMRKLFLSILCLLESGQSTAQTGGAYGRDRCVDEAYQQFRSQLLAGHPGQTSFTNSLSTARNLYQNMFLQGFTSSAFYSYCATYKRAKNEFDRCPYSSNKETLINGLGLADYLCIRRIDAFARNLPCLQNYHVYTLQTCGQRCNQFGGAPQTAPSQNAFAPYPFIQNGFAPNSINQAPYNQFQSSNLNFAHNNGIQTMAADCQYQRCLAECRRPLFEQQCGRESGTLELDALYTTYAAIRNVQEPLESRSYDQGYSSTFPAECQALAANGASRNAMSLYVALAGFTIVFLVFELF